MTTRIRQIKPPEVRELEKKRAELAALELDGAITECRTAIRLQPDNAQAHGLLGLALEMKGDRLAALDEIEKARELDPSASSIAEAFERIRRKAGKHGTI